MASAVSTVASPSRDQHSREQHSREQLSNESQPSPNRNGDTVMSPMQSAHTSATQTLPTHDSSLPDGAGSQGISPSLTPITSPYPPPSLQDATTTTVPLPPPPPYTSPLHGGIHQGLFMPYVTQELPHYSEFGGPISQRGDIQLGFLRQSGGQYVPIQIPGYISTSTEENPTVRNIGPPSLSHRNNDRRHQHQHSTNNFVPARQRDSEVPILSPNDYFKCTFTLLIVCILFLNLPAVLMLMVALFFSVKVKERHGSRNYAKCRKYSTTVLVCNYLALLEFFVILICGFAIIILVFVFNVSFS